MIANILKCQQCNLEVSFDPSNPQPAVDAVNAHFTDNPDHRFEQLYVKAN